VYVRGVWVVGNRGVATPCPRCRPAQQHGRTLWLDPSRCSACV
jgi:hypothetical protein